MPADKSTVRLSVERATSAQKLALFLSLSQSFVTYGRFGALRHIHDTELMCKPRG